MSLLTFDAGPLRSAIADRLQVMGLSVNAAAPSEDWFEARPLARLIRGDEPQALALADRLSAASGSPLPCAL